MKDKFKSVFHKVLVKLGHEKFEATAKLADGQEIFTTDDEWQVGSPVFTRDENGEPVAVPDGEYPLETGETLVVTDGLLSELKPMEEQEAAKEDKEEFKQFALVIQALNDKIDSKFSEIEQRFADQEKRFGSVEQKMSAAGGASVKETAAKKPVNIGKMNNSADRVFAILNNSK